MIYKLTVHNKDPKQAICPWWHELEWLKKGKKKKTLEFKPGLNIIFGKNGSGKSTVLTTIAKLLCCYDGDAQLVGQYTTGREYYNYKDNGDDDPTQTIKLGVEPHHDGSPIMHFSPVQDIGVVGGSFDYDFLFTGIRNMQFKGSQGQNTVLYMSRFMEAARTGKWPEVVWKVRKEMHPLLVEFLKGDGKPMAPPCFWTSLQ